MGPNHKKKVKCLIHPTLTFLALTTRLVLIIQHTPSFARTILAWKLVWPTTGCLKCKYAYCIFIRRCLIYCTRTIHFFKHYLFRCLIRSNCLGFKKKTTCTLLTESTNETRIEALWVKKKHDTRCMQLFTLWRTWNMSEHQLYLHLQLFNGI